MGRRQNHRIDIGLGEHGLQAVKQSEPLFAGELFHLVGMAHRAGGKRYRRALALHRAHQILSPPAEAGDTGLDHAFLRCPLRQFLVLSTRQ